MLSTTIYTYKLVITNDSGQKIPCSIYNAFLFQKVLTILLLDL